MNDRRRIALVGPSIRFLSGISYYTIQLSNALSERADVEAILFRHMLPKRFFPGWKRVGDNLVTKTFSPKVIAIEMLDWHDPLSWIRATKRMKRAEIIIFQWWTSSVAHMHLAIQLLLFHKVPIIIEYHEVMDPLEQSLMPIRVYSKIIGRMVRRCADHFVVHSESDKRLIQQQYQIDSEKISIIPHGLYDQYPILETSAARASLGISEEHVILFFGLLRPYKGVRYLIEAFNTLPDILRSSSRLLIVGENWEDTESISMAERSPYRDNISIVDRYINDREIPLYFSAADILVLPYTRASQSGVAHIGMAFGLPIIATKVGGIEEGLRPYSGAFFIPPENIKELLEMLVFCIERKGRFPPPYNLAWSCIGKEWISLFESILADKPVV